MCVHCANVFCWGIEEAKQLRTTCRWWQGPWESGCVKGVPERLAERRSARHNQHVLAINVRFNILICVPPHWCYSHLEGRLFYYCLFFFDIRYSSLRAVRCSGWCPCKNRSGWLKELVDKSSREQKTRILNAVMTKKTNGRHYSLNPDTEEAQDEMYCRASSLVLLHSLVVSAIYAESVRQFLWRRFFANNSIAELEKCINHS